MATVQRVVIEVKADTKDVKATIDQLEKVGKVDRKNAASFKKTSSEFEEAAKRRAFLLDRAIKRLEKLQKERQKAFNPKDIRRFDDRIKETSSDIDVLGGKIQRVDKQSGALGGTLGKLGAVVVGAFAVGAIVNFTEHLFELAVESEAFEKRAKTVFGESFEVVEKFAEQSAKSLGLTEVAFLGAAAAIGDILVPLGLTRERAAEMSVEAVKLGGALKQFTGDSRSAAEISNIVARALTGEVEGLKTLGVVVDQTSKEFKDLVKSKRNDLGLTQQQAKAEAIFQIAIESSGDALNAFENNTDSLARQEAILTATLEEQTEHLAEALIPTFLSALKLINSFSKTTKDLAQELVKQNEAFEKQEKEVTTLVSRYDELSSQTELNAEEQAELRDIITDLTDRVPQAATEFDKYGNALDVNTEKVIANLEQQENILRLRNAETIKEIREEIEGFTKDVTENTRVLNKGFVTTTTFSKTQKVLIEDIALTASEIQALRNENILLNADSAELLLTLEELGIELTDLEKEFIDAALGLDKFKESTEDSNTETKEQFRNVFFLKNAISELRKEQQEQATSLGRVVEITKEIIPLQAELNRLTGKESAKDANEALQRRIDLLSLFQKETSKTISLIEAQAEQQRLLNQEILEEEEEFAAEGADFRIAQFQRTMDGRRQALEIELQQEQISQEEFNESIADLDKEAADNKIREAQRAASVANDISRAGFSLLLSQQDRKLQLLENETTVAIRELQDRRDKNLITEEEFTEKRSQIEKEADEERKIILRKRATLEKTAAIIDATINTAIAVTKALETSIPFAALVAALGAAEIAVIASQPIPEFHEGKKPELKEGEVMAKILKTESVIPPEQSKKYKGVIDSMIDGNLEKYVFEKYTLPMIKSANNTSSSTPFNDINLWNEQRKQSGIMREGNALTRELLGRMGNTNAWRTWR